MRLPAAGWSWGIALCVLLALAWSRGANPQEPERVAGALSQSAYIWQRAWEIHNWNPADANGYWESTPVVDALPHTPAAIGQLLPLYAEITWLNGKPQPALVDIDWEALVATGRDIGVTIRVLEPPVIPPDHYLVGSLIGTARNAIRQAREHGITLREVQLDIDYPTSRLGEYAAWLARFKARLGDTHVSITALPTWLDSPDFPLVIAACNDYVLQVHQLTVPTSTQSITPLCDPDLAQDWITEAALLGHPFRIALPTYGYRVAFEGEDRFVGLVAEQAIPEHLEQEGYTWIALEADPSAMATLVADLEREHPALLTGICWFRLPVATDQGTWPMATLEAVSAGSPPAPQVVGLVRRPESGLIDVSVVNQGSGRTSKQVLVQLTWGETPAPYVEALPGIRMSVTKNQVEFWMPEGVEGRLDPGEVRSLGWLRFPTTEEVQVVVSTP